MLNSFFNKVTNVKASTWIFSSMIWIFALEYALYLIGDVYWDRVIKVSAFLLVLIFFKRSPNAIRNSEKNILLIFYLLLLTLLVPAILNGDESGFYQWSKFAMMTLIFPILLMDGHTFQGKDDSLSSLYIWLGLAFSIQAITGFLAIRWNLLDISNIVEMDRRPDVPQIDLGLLGFGNAIQPPVFGVRTMRPQGWFLEPSILSAFLLFPLFRSFGEYLESSRVQYLLSSLIMFIALFLTVSLAAYLAIIATILFALLSRPLYQLVKNIKIIKYAYCVVILLIFFLCASGLMKGLNKANEINKKELSESSVVALTMFARDSKGPSGNLVREYDRVGGYLKILSSNPAGIGLSHTLGMNSWGTANAFFFWIISGGVPALLLLAVFFGYVFVYFCHPLLVSENSVYKFIAASFIGHSIQHLSYGNWLAPFFLIHLAILIMTCRQLIQKMKFISDKNLKSLQN